MRYNVRRILFAECLHFGCLNSVSSCESGIYSRYLSSVGKFQDFTGKCYKIMSSKSWAANQHSVLEQVLTVDILVRSRNLACNKPWMFFRCLNTFNTRASTGYGVRECQLKLCWRFLFCLYNGSWITWCISLHSAGVWTVIMNSSSAQTVSLLKKAKYLLPIP